MSDVDPSAINSDGATGGAIRKANVLVVGGGNAGISLAARLHREGVPDVVIVEPKTVHTYRPLLNYAGVGLIDLDRVQRPQSTVMPDGVHWIRDRVSAVNPATKTVTLAGKDNAGKELVQYKQLVICAGSQPDWDELPGSRDAMASDAAATTFVPEYTEKTWDLVRGLTRGRAVFVIADKNGPCAQTGQKVAYLACDHWKRNGVLDSIEVTLVTPVDGITGFTEVDRKLAPWVERYGVNVIDRAEVDSIDVATQQVGVSRDDETHELPYDLLYLVPPYAAPSWIREADLAAPNGYVDVNVETLQHRRFIDIWACGDAAEAQCERSGGALRKQTAVLAANLISVTRGDEPTKRYDGYSVMPVTPARGFAALPEFDRSGQLVSSTPGIKHITPRRWLWLVDRYVLPQVYWRRILRGK